MLIDQLQACADRYAKRLSDGSYGLLFDIKANERRKITSVDIYDSTVDDSDREKCMTEALEHMEVPTSATAMRQEVSPQSRSLVGVAQAAAAPIALAPIVLVAGGVTILVGVTIYAAAEVAEEGWKAKCAAHYAACMTTNSARKIGNHLGQTRCGICARVCVENQEWPFEVGNGSCAYWKRGW